ncbi:MAG: MFS transporter [Thermoplasmata archaeon]|nr:MFS transporter [Thermoplasmata archaeon]
MLWPSIAGTFGQPVGALGVVLAVDVAGAATSASLVGITLRRWGIGRQLAISAAIMAVAVATFVLAPVWFLFIAGAFLYGLGAGGLDAGINAFSATHRGVRYLNSLHAVYGIGVTIGPLAATLAVEHGAWRDPYVAILSLLLCLVLGSAFLWRFPQADPSTLPPRPIGVGRWSTRRKIERQALMTIMVFFFLYAGLEATTGQWAFTLLTHERGLPTVLSGIGVSSFWGSLLAGRFLASLAGHRMSPPRILLLSSGGALIGIALLSQSPWAIVGFLGLPIAGFSLGPFFPTLISAVPAWAGTERSNTIVGWGIATANVGIGAVSVIAAGIVETVGLPVLGALLIAISVGLAVAVGVAGRKLGAGP